MLWRLGEVILRNGSQFSALKYGNLPETFPGVLLVTNAFAWGIYNLWLEQNIVSFSYFFRKVIELLYENDSLLVLVQFRWSKLRTQKNRHFS